MVFSKPWYKSWLIWLGIVQSLAGAGGVVYEFLVKGDFSAPSIALLIAGISAVFLRVISAGTVIER